MTVTINKTDGTVLTTIVDGAVDTTSTNIALVGRLYRNYGELINENLVKLLENFANSTSPSTPIIGQIWYDTTNKSLKVYRDTGFVPLARITSNVAEPTNPLIGDLWWDLTDEQLKMFNSTEWIVIAPGYTAAQTKTGAFSETIKDIFSVDHIALILYQQNQPVAIFSNDAEYIPQNAISGFTTIKSGLTLSSDTDGVHSTADDSALLGGISASQFLRSDINDSTSGTLSVANDLGFNVGADDDINISVSGTTGIIKKVTTGDLQFNIGVTPAMTINNGRQVLVGNGSGALPSLSFISDNTTGISHGTGTVDVSIAGTQAASISATGLSVTENVDMGGNLDVTGDSSLLGDLAIDGNVTLGSVSLNVVTVNAGSIDLTNDTTFTTGDVIVENNVTVGGSTTLNSNVSITGVTSATGNVNITGSATISNRLAVNTSKFVVDTTGRIMVNATTPATGYNKPGDITLGTYSGSGNGIYARNVPRYVVTFNGTLSGLGIYRSHNVSTVTRTTTGTYVLTLYDDTGTPVPLTSAYPTLTGGTYGAAYVTKINLSSAGDTSITLRVYNASGVLYDSDQVSVALYDGAN